MISFMVPTKPDWSGLVLSTQNLSYNSEFVHLPSWYRPQLDRVVDVVHRLGRKSSLSNVNSKRPSSFSTHLP